LSPAAIKRRETALAAWFTENREVLEQLRRDDIRHATARRQRALAQSPLQPHEPRQRVERNLSAAHPLSLKLS